MRKNTIAILFVSLSLLTFSLAACAGKKDPTEVNVRLSDFKIEMDKTSIPAGPIKFIINNAGTIKHEVVLEPAGADDQPFEAGGKESEHENIGPGESATLEWTLDQPGSYQLSCHVKENNIDHFALGMFTKFTVTKP